MRSRTLAEMLKVPLRRRKKILGKSVSLVSQQGFWNLVWESSEEEDELPWRS